MPCRDNLCRLAECGDLHALMVAAVSAWVGECHPDADTAAVYVWAGDAPATRVMVPVSSGASAPRPVPQSA